MLFSPNNWVIFFILGGKRIASGSGWIWQANRNHEAHDGGFECHTNKPFTALEELHWIPNQVLRQLPSDHARSEQVR